MQVPGKIRVCILIYLKNNKKKKKKKMMMMMMMMMKKEGDDNVQLSQYVAQISRMAGFFHTKRL